MFNKKNLYVSAETYRDVYSVTAMGQRENVLNSIEKYQNLSYDIANMYRILSDTFRVKYFVVDFWRLRYLRNAVKHAKNV